MADHATQTTPYVLYHNRFSVCSLMVRYSLAIRGTARDASANIVVDEREVDIFGREQLKEDFLCEVNPKGQVPVLTHNVALPKPIQDSMDITLYIAERYPDLIPQSHKDEIIHLLQRLHSINYFSLSFSGKPEIAFAVLRDPVVQLLERPDISERYRDALRYKLKIVEENKIGGITPVRVEEELQRTQSVLSTFNSRLSEGQGPWLFGDRPTALDAHALIFLARLQDVGRANLIPPELETYLAMAMETKEWQAVMDGRRTMKN